MDLDTLHVLQYRLQVQTQFFLQLHQQVEEVEIEIYHHILHIMVDQVEVVKILLALEV